MIRVVHVTLIPFNSRHRRARARDVAKRTFDWFRTARPVISWPAIDLARRLFWIVGRMLYQWATILTEPLYRGRKIRIAMLTLVTYLSLC
jgi:hypothetical protein